MNPTKTEIGLKPCMDTTLTWDLAQQATAPQVTCPKSDLCSIKSIGTFGTAVIGDQIICP